MREEKICPYCGKWIDTKETPTHAFGFTESRGIRRYFHNQCFREDQKKNYRLRQEALQ